MTAAPLLDWSELDWEDKRLLRFAEWFGYNIEPNDDSTLGFSVTSPGGKKLGGFVAKRVIEAWQKNPDSKAVGKDGKAKGGGKGGAAGGKGGGKGKAASGGKGTAKATVDPAEAKNKALAGLDETDPHDLEERSNGKLNADDVSVILSRGRQRLEAATDPKEIASIVKETKAELAAYKKERTKPPTRDERLIQTKAKIVKAFPRVVNVSGPNFDAGEAGDILSKYKGKIESAGSEEEAHTLMTQMRQEIRDRKRENTANQRAAKDEEKAIRAANTNTGSVQTIAKQLGFDTVEVIKGSPKDKEAISAQLEKLARANPDIIYALVPGRDGTYTIISKVKPKRVQASEWDEYYTKMFYSPGQPRNKDGEFAHTGGSVGGGSGPLPEQKAALLRYQSAGYQGINPMLRGTRFAGQNDPKRKAELETDIKHIDGAMKPLGQSFVAHRGVQMDAFGVDNVDALSKLSGKTFTDKGYMSTAIGEKVNPAFKSKQVHMKINIPAGTKAFHMPDIAPDARMKAEKELVLGRGQKFRVDSVKYNSRSGKWNMEATILA